jgi:hypothetical protein
MGLDNYASRTPGDPELSEEDERAFEEAGLKLCGGIFSGDESSFRGKVYERLILGVTDVSLRQEWIPPEVVREMAATLATCDPETVAGEYDESSRVSITPGVVRDLRRFFVICAERDLGLIGWW